MKKLLISGVGLLSALMVLEPALAADIGVKPKRERAAPQRAAPQRAASNWSGGQLGGSNGASSVNNNFAEPGSFICPFGTSLGSSCFETPFQFSGHPVSYTVGPFAGYRFQFGNFVVGIEGDVSWKRGETSASQSSTTTFACCSASRTDAFSGSVKQTWDGSVRGRAGTLVTPWTLVYGTAGVAFEEIKGTFSFTGTLFGCPSPTGCASVLGTATTSVSFNETRVGGTVGAGAETEVWPGVKVRGEYRYTDFGTFTKNFPLTTSCTSCGTPSSGVSIRLRESFHTFRVGIGVDL